jgi:hypothetical protein
MFVRILESCDERGMDSSTTITLLTTCVALFAGVAPTKWPHQKWVADIVLTVSGLGALVSLGYMINQNGGIAMLQKPIFFIALGLVVAVTGVIWQLRQNSAIAPAAEQEISANVEHTASVTLLMRPSQDPQEIANHNMYRWFVFRSVGLNANGNQTNIIGNYFFLIFEKPINSTYRRVTSLSNPNLMFNIIDISNRSAVIEISNTDLSGQTVELKFSDAPI